MTTQTGSNDGSLFTSAYYLNEAIPSALAPTNWGLLIVAQLATVGAEGDTAFAVDGLKVGDTTGNGGGVPVYRSQGEWRTHNNDAAVAS